MPIVRIQAGHVGRTTGATGAYNPRLKISEASMNKLFVERMEEMIDEFAPLIAWQFTGPDEEPDSQADMFISIHMDGNDSPEPDRPSVGRPPGDTQSFSFANILKKRRSTIPGSLAFRDDNYSGAALERYYGYNDSYDGGADVSVVYEVGFVTNDEELEWVMTNRDQIVRELILSVYEYYGLAAIKPLTATTTPTPGSVQDALSYTDSRQNDRITSAREANVRNALAIKDVEAKVNHLDNEMDEVIDILARRISILEQDKGDPVEPADASYLHADVAMNRKLIQGILDAIGAANGRIAALSKD